MKSKSSSWLPAPFVIVLILGCISSGVYSQQQLVDPDGAAGQVDPRMGVDDEGNFYALWQDYRDGAHVRFSYRPAGGSFGESAPVDPSTTSYQGQPSLAVDEAGNAYATWEDRRDNSRHVRFAYRPNGGPWGAGEVISPSTERQLWPVMAGNTYGAIVAAWTQDAPDGNYDVYAAIRPAGGPWGQAESVTDTTGGSHVISVAMDEMGQAYAIWRDDRNGRYDLYFSTLQPAGGWTANVQVNDDIGDASLHGPDLAVDAGGNLLAVWEDSRNGDSDIYSAHRPAGGSWSADARVSDDTNGSTQSEASISILDDDYAAAVWVDDRAEITSIYGAGRPVGGTWGSNVLLHTLSLPTARFHPDEPGGPLPFSHVPPPGTRRRIAHPGIFLADPFVATLFYATVIQDAIDAPSYFAWQLASLLVGLGVKPDEAFLETGDLQPFIAWLNNVFGHSSSDRAPILPTWTATGGDLSDTTGFSTEYTAREAGDQFVTATLTFSMDARSGGDIPGPLSRVTLSDTAIVHVSAAAERVDTSPTEFSLSQNYPNPFSSKTVIQFGVRRSCHVNLGIYDLHGHEVAQLLDAVHLPGAYRIKIETPGLVAGAYFYRIDMDEFHSIKRMVVVK